MLYIPSKIVDNSESLLFQGGGIVKENFQRSTLDTLSDQMKKDSYSGECVINRDSNP